MKDLFTALLFFQVHFASAQPVIEWQRTVGGIKFDWAMKVCQWTSGGFYVGGSSYSDSSGYKSENTIGPYGYPDFWIVNLDANGNFLGDNTIGSDGQDYLTALVATADGYAAAGRSNGEFASGDKDEQGFPGYDYWIYSGEAQNTISGFEDDLLTCMIRTSDGGYMVGGYSSSDSSVGDKTEPSMGMTDYWILKLDAAMDIEWQNTIGGSGYDFLTAIEQTADGGYILAGASASDSSGDKTENGIGGGDLWILKLNPSGTIEWQNTIGGNDYDDYFYHVSIRPTTDGGYVVGTSSKSDSSGDKTENAVGSYDYWIVKLDPSGNVVWDKTIGGPDEDYFKSLDATDDGGCVICGLSYSGAGGDKSEDQIGAGDFWIVKLDSLGHIEWENTIGGTGYDGPEDIIQTTDGGYAIAGASGSPISGDKTEEPIGEGDYWIVKLYPDSVTSVPAIANSSGSDISIFPNPFNTTVTITLNHEGNFDFLLYDVFGREVLKSQIRNPNSQIERGNLPAGIYFYRLEEEKKIVASGKVVIE